MSVNMQKVTLRIAVELSTEYERVSSSALLV